METTEIRWSPDDTARPEMVIPMMDDSGLGEESLAQAVAAREATRQYCLQLICNGETSMGDLQLQAGAFYDGYQACLHNHGRLIE